MKRKRRLPQDQTDNEDLSSRKRASLQDSCEEVIDEESVDLSQKVVEEVSSLDLSQRPDFLCSTVTQDEAEVGIIEKVTLKNFMSHNYQEVNFGSRVNFIVGNNGSGKSAIMMALVVGLGGKANATNRGSSVQSFIQHGKHSAEVSVRLRNRGMDAYKPEVYGNSICVERKISKVSKDSTTFRLNSSYRLKNAQGKVVSMKREELSHILDNFNIQVDNPIVVLNQDTSRQFLHSKSPQDKYKFFLKATQLEQMKKDYVNANESQDVANEIVRHKHETLPILEKEVFEWQQKYQALESLHELKAKVNLLKNELLWAYICEKEKKCEQDNKQLRTEEARTPKYLKKVEESDAEVVTAQNDHAAIEAELQEIGKNAAAIEPNYRKVRQEKEEKKKLSRTTDQDMRKLQKDIASINRDKQQILQRISQLQSSDQRQFEARRLAREQRMAALDEQIETLSAQRKTIEQDIVQYQNAVTENKREQSQLRNEQNELNRQLHGTRRHLQDLEGAQQNSLRRFGSYVPNLIEAIEDAHSRGRFHQRPRGPVGAHFTLLDQSWALAVETCLKSLLFAFCVHDHHDERELERLIQKICPEGKRPATITSPFKSAVYNVCKNRPEAPNYPTILEVLDIKDPVIANCLIDQRSIESVLLIKDSEESRRVMSRNPPRKAREAFNKDGDQLHCNPFRFYSAAGDKAKILVSSVEENLRQVRADMKRLDSRSRLVLERVQTASRQQTASQQELSKASAHIMKLQEKISGLRLELDELGNEDEPTAADVQTLEGEVHSLDEHTNNLNDRLQQRTQQHNAAHQAFLDAEKQFSQLEKDMMGITDKTETVKERMTFAENQLVRARSKKQHYENKMREHEATLGEIRGRLDDDQRILDDKTQAAEKICARIRTKRTPQNLESEIRQIQKQVASEEKNRGNSEEILLNFKRTRDAFLAAKKKVGKLKAFLSTFSKVMVERKARYLEFRRMIATRSKFLFTMTLSTRKYAGNMDFDHQRELLDLQVQPSVESEESSSDMRTLSGGERSFSTVCFILSLWEAMESPFRCLDEFDIFMDMVNRRIAMDMMMSVARQQPGRQFIFLTPQDMSQLGISTDIVKIFQMRAPDRTQSTLPYGKTTEDEDMGTSVEKS